MPSINSIGHLIIGVVAAGCVTALAALHDVSGSSALEVLIAIAGLTTTAAASSKP